MSVSPGIPATSTRGIRFFSNSSAVPSVIRFSTAIWTSLVGHSRVLISDSMTSVSASRRMLKSSPMYLVRVSMRSHNGSPFHWDFTEPTDDQQQAVHNAIRTFLSGLTIEEKRAAKNSLDVVAHP